MNYTVEGYIGILTLPVNAIYSTLTFKIVPTGEYAGEFPDGKDPFGKKKRQMILLGEDNTALILDPDLSFSMDIKHVRDLALVSMRFCGTTQREMSISLTRMDMLMCRALS